MGAMQQVFVAGGVAAVATDSYISSVRVLAHMNGTNGGTTFANSSPNTTPPSTNSNGATTDTGTKKFGSAGMSNVSNGIYAASLGALDDIGTGDFAHEFWFYTASPSADVYLSDYGRVTNATTSFQIKTTSSAFIFWFNGSARITGGTVSTSTWQHVACARTSGVTSMWIDGTLAGSTYTDSNTYTGNGRIAWLGRDQNNNGGTNRYDDWRITVGSDRGYTGSTITVPVAQFPDS